VGFKKGGNFLNEKASSIVNSVIGWSTFVAITIALYAVFVYVPTEKMMGIVQRIFYFHVPSAWVAFLAFLVVFVGSVAYLWKKDRKWDILALSSAEIGVVFTSLVLITGPIWAKPVWGAWWVWDVRLTTTLVLWLIYVAYLMLRSTAGGGDRTARFAAVFGIIGFIDVPIVFMSIRWWRSLHPIVVATEGGGLHPSMLATLLISLGAFTLLYVYLLRQRVALEWMKAEVEEIKEEMALRRIA
jgi:heme exporter protein C